MKRILLILLCVPLIGFGQQYNKQIFGVWKYRTDKWLVDGYTNPNMIFETLVYKDSITVKLVKGNGKAMNKLIGTPKFTKVFIGNVEVSETEFILQTKEVRVSVTRFTKTVYVIVEEKDDFSGDILKNTYFGKR